MSKWKALEREIGSRITISRSCDVIENALAENTARVSVCHSFSLSLTHKHNCRSPWMPLSCFLCFVYLIPSFCLYFCVSLSVVFLSFPGVPYINPTSTEVPVVDGLNRKEVKKKKKKR